MADVVQIKCPHCQNSLRVPIAWTEQPMRCKHCQQVFQAKKRAAAPPPPEPSPAVVAVVPNAAPANGSPFAFSEPAGPVVLPARRPAPRKTGGLPVKALFLGGVVFLGVGIAALVVVLVLGSTLLGLVNPSSGQHAQATDKTPTATPTTTGSELPKDTRIDTGKGPIDTGKGKDPVKDNDPPAFRTDNIYPRRALLISVNDYLLAGPLAYGKPPAGDYKGSSTAAVAEALQKNLDFPRIQIGELSDKAKAPTTPQKAAIENTIVEFLATSRSQDHIVLLFAGHAVEIDKEAYLVPLEGKIGDPKSLIALGWLYQKLIECKARQKVLILDVCRFDPTRGAARPGSGPMGAVLEARLKAPPAGVQVWASCSAKEQSWESADGSLFLEALCKGCKDLPTPHPYAIPIKKLQGRVRLEMDERSNAIGHKQTPFLVGSEPGGEGPYNVKDLPPAVAIKPAVIVPKKDTDIAALKHILDELALIPPTTASKVAGPLDPMTLPEYPAKGLEVYKPDYKSILDFRDRQAEFPLRFQLAKSILALRDNAAGVAPLRQTIPGKAPDNGLKKVVKDEQNRIGKPNFLLKDTLQELLDEGEKHRGKETKRVQALYDYLVLRMKQRMVFVMEYNFALAQIGTDLQGVAALEPDEKVYRLMPQEKVNVNVNYVKDYVKDLKSGWKAFTKTYANTPWEFAAQRDQTVLLGLAWKGAKN